MTAVERHIDWDIVKCLVLAGPGFVKDDFKKHLEEEAVRRDLRYLKPTFLQCFGNGFPRQVPRWKPWGCSNRRCLCTFGATLEAQVASRIKFPLPKADCVGEYPVQVFTLT